MENYNYGVPLELDFSDGEEKLLKMAKDFSEGNEKLEQVLLKLWKNNIKTWACCVGHEGIPGSAYISIIVNEASEKLIENLTNNKDSEKLIENSNKNGEYIKIEFGPAGFGDKLTCNLYCSNRKKIESILDLVDKCIDMPELQGSKNNDLTHLDLAKAFFALTDKYQDMGFNYSMGTDKIGKPARLEVNSKRFSISENCKRGSLSEIVEELKNNKGSSNEISDISCTCDMKSCVDYLDYLGVSLEKQNGKLIINSNTRETVKQDEQAKFLDELQSGVINAEDAYFIDEIPNNDSKDIDKNYPVVDDDGVWL